MNSTLLGGGVRQALAKAQLNLTAEATLCVGGCQKWDKSEEGIERYD